MIQILSFIREQNREKTFIREKLPFSQFTSPYTLLARISLIANLRHKKAWKLETEFLRFI